MYISDLMLAYIKTTSEHGGSWHFVRVVWSEGLYMHVRDSTWLYIILQFIKTTAPGSLA